MLLDREYKVPSKTNSKINLKVVPGHFATTSSHINFYMDMTTLKVRQKEAYEVAREMAKEYQYSKPIDTIVCMDGCEIIGACLAEELNKNGIMSLNQHDSLYVITPEFDGNGQMIFRDNLQPMVRGKNILLLLASATTGRTIARSLECIQYYGGIIQRFSAQQKKFTVNLSTASSQQRIYRTITPLHQVNVHTAKTKKKLMRL